MTIILSDETSSRGPKDARRHRELSDDVLKKALPDIILSEDVITGENAGKKFVVRIPVIDNPDFRYGRRDGKKDEDGGEGGLGQGNGGVDDVIGKRPGKGKGGKGQGAGDGIGENEGRGSGIPSEVTWEEILALWERDIGLPNMSNKKTSDEFVTEYKISGITDSGPRVLLKRRETYHEGLKRFYAYMEALQSMKKKSELECFTALKDAENHMLHEAIALLESADFTVRYDEVEPFPLYETEDMRFSDTKLKKKPITKAVIIAVIDISASMDEGSKQYVLKSILFWVVQFLRREYKTITIRFVVHPAKDAPAAVVSEQEAFRTRADGSATYIYQGLEKALELFTYEYDLKKCDGYVFNFSDGDDFGIEKTIGSIEKLIKKGVSMFGHIEVHIGHFDRNERLLKEIIRTFLLEKSKEGTATARDMTVFAGTQARPIVCVIPENQEHIRLSVAALLKKDRWSKKS